MSRKSLIRRLKAAYEANNIPYDPWLDTLEEWALVQNAEYWEKKASGEDAITIREAKAMIDRVAGPTSRGLTQAGRAVSYHERTYHGDSFTE